MVKASDHTISMIEWWLGAGIDRVDLAIRRTCGAMVWHQDQRLEALPLPWARAENVRQADVYVRPERARPWPLVFLDDVPEGVARQVAGKYDALVVRTSRRGGCHVWLQTATALDEGGRGLAQRWLTERIEADPGSVSGEHLGRLAGFRNWKRSGEWVNVVVSTDRGRSWDPQVAFRAVPRTRARLSRGQAPVPGRDGSPSGREWGWICGLLEAGQDAAMVRERLAREARFRRGPDADRYASRTVRRAASRVGGCGGSAGNSGERG